MSHGVHNGNILPADGPGVANRCKGPTCHTGPTLSLLSTHTLQSACLHRVTSSQDTKTVIVVQLVFVAFDELGIAYVAQMK